MGVQENLAKNSHFKYRPKFLLNCSTDIRMIIKILNGVEIVFKRPLIKLCYSLNKSKKLFPGRWSETRLQGETGDGGKRSLDTDGAGR